MVHLSFLGVVVALSLLSFSAHADDSSLSVVKCREPSECLQRIEERVNELAESPPVEDDEKKPKKRRFFILWGYNRTFFGPTNSTFETEEGTFTIHQSQGYDRPTPFDPLVYFDPTKLSIPQYNITAGYMFSPRFGIEIGQDHMKWVFDPNRHYEITGDYQPTVYVADPANPEGPPVARSFEEIKQSGDASWLRFEHTNGYNYVFLGMVYEQPIYETPDGKFGVEGRFGAGAGLFIPQTSVFMHRDQAWNWRGYDNRFHVAGGGGHASAALKLTLFKHLVLLATARGTLIGVTDALVNESGARLTQTPIPAIEFIGQIGYQGSITGRKSRVKR
jgi:hypothetical protein